MRIINVKLLILLTMLLSSCIVHKHYHDNSFFEKYSEDEIHVLIILNYIKHINKDCNKCRVLINGTLSFKSDSFKQHNGSTWNDVEVDENRNINLGDISFEVEDFGNISFTTIDFGDNLYEFTPLYFDKKNQTITGEVTKGDDSYIFMYNVIKDHYFLSLNFNDNE